MLISEINLVHVRCDDRPRYKNHRVSTYKEDVNNTQTEGNYSYFLFRCERNIFTWTGRLLILVVYMWIEDVKFVLFKFINVRNYTLSVRIKFWGFYVNFCIQQ